MTGLQKSEDMTGKRPNYFKLKRAKSCPRDFFHDFSRATTTRSPPPSSLR